MTELPVIKMTLKTETVTGMVCRVTTSRAEYWFFKIYAAIYNVFRGKRLERGVIWDPDRVYERSYKDYLAVKKAFAKGAVTKQWKEYSNDN